LKKSYPGDYYLYVGTDMFLTLHQWREAKWIFDNAVIAVMDRYENSDIIAQKEYLENTFGARIILISGKTVEISSTEIRDSLKNNTSSRLLDTGVYDYIKENSLYTERKSMTELREYVKGMLPEKRFSHTLAVEKETLYIASHLCPEFAGELCRAALLHDVTKYLPPDEHAKIADALTENDIKSPDTLHANSGAVVARKMGEPMWRTVASHTTGKADMSLFEMILFTADYTEETRTHDTCKKERAFLHDAIENARSFAEKRRALEEAVKHILENTVSYLKEKNTFIHPRTLDALDFYRR